MIRVEGLSKIFRIPHQESRTVFHTLLSIARRRYQYEEFYALRDINFTIAQGEFLGIIGRNGSGKSTLLKILAGIYWPTNGKIEIRDEVYPLLELGVGFQPDFTVLDNIYLYGCLLGYSRPEMKPRVETILAFSELERFADTKLKNLSTGMQVRLGFAIAIQSRAPIILVDEVLAVGDLIFAEKCRKAFWEFKNEGRTIVFVSHSLDSIREYCDRVLVLEHGAAVDQGTPETMIELYQHGILQQA